MKLLQYYSCFIILYIFILTGHCQIEKPRFRVQAPQFICSDSKKTSKTVNSIDSFTIRLQSMFDEKLTYNWSVRFKTLNPSKGQRFNLNVWKASRNLEKILSKNSQNVSQTNLLTVKNDLLIEGVEYIFNVSARNEKSVYSDVDNFVLRYMSSADDLKKSFFSVIMLGSKISYANIPYLLEAEVIPCTPTDNYYFEWKVFEVKNNNSINMEPTVGKRLFIKPRTFVGGQSYRIQSQIKKIDDNSIITTNYFTVSVLKREMNVILNIDETVISSKIPLIIFATLEDPDNNPGSIFFQWICKQISDGNNCAGFQSVNSSEVYFESGFPTDGSYEIQIIVQKNNIKATNKCTIIVQTGMLPTIDLEKASINVVAGETVEVAAKVMNLMSGCSLKWVSSDQKGFATLDLQELKSFQNVMSVKSLDETFISELVDYSNDTVSRNFPLTIPAKSGTWQGLKADQKYKFCLIVKCSCLLNNQCEGPNVTVYSSATVFTNGPPVPKPIQVKPLSGVALFTEFTIFTEAAKDIFIDYPLAYTFGYKIPDGETVIIGTYLEVFNIKLILPYSALEISPFLKICDSRGACSEIEGLLITTTNSESLSEENINKFTDKFVKNLYRKEYSDAFYLAFAVMKTLKISNENLFNIFQTNIENAIVNDLNKVVNEVKQKRFIMTSNSYIQEVTKFIQIFPLSNNILQEIVRLRDTIFEVASGNLQNEKYVMKPSSDRKKRSITDYDIKSFIDVSEYVMTTSKNQNEISKEKIKLLSKLRTSEKDLCDKVSKEPIVIDSQIVSIGIEKMNLRSNNDLKIFIPYSTRSGSKLNISSIAEVNLRVDNQIKELCFVKYVLYPNIIESSSGVIKNNLIYYLSIYTSDLKLLLKELDNFYFKVPVSKLFDEIPQCIKWDQNNWNWNTNSCITFEKYSYADKVTYITCKCSGSGYYSTYYKKMQEITQTIESTTISTKITTVKVITEIDIKQNNSSICKSMKNCKISSQSNNINLVGANNNTAVTLVSTILVFILVGIVSLYCYKRKKNYRINSTNTENIQYAKLHDDYLLDGSKESLDEIDLFADEIF